MSICLFSKSIFALSVCRWDTKSERHRERKMALASAANPDSVVRALPGALVWGCLFIFFCLCFGPDWNLHSNRSGCTLRRMKWSGYMQYSSDRDRLKIRESYSEAICFWSSQNEFQWMKGGGGVSVKLSKESTCWLGHVFWRYRSAPSRAFGQGKWQWRRGYDGLERADEQRMRGRRGRVKMPVVSSVISQTALLP